MKRINQTTNDFIQALATKFDEAGTGLEVFLNNLPVSSAEEFAIFFKKKIILMEDESFLTLEIHIFSKDTSKLMRAMDIAVELLQNSYEADRAVINSVGSTEASFHLRNSDYITTSILTTNFQINLI